MTNSFTNPPSKPASPSRRSALGWTLVIEATTTVSGALIFWLLARLFEPAEYGRLGGLLALALIAGPLATFGAIPVLLSRVANRTQLGEDIGAAIVTALIGTGILTAVLTIVQPFIFSGIDRLTVLIFMVGQLMAFWVTELAIHCTLGLARQRLGALLRVVSASFRLIGFVVYVQLVDEATLRGWAWVTLVSGVGSALAVHVLLAFFIGSRPMFTPPAWREFPSGLTFGLSTTAEGFLDASDRPLLLRYGFEAGAGVYSAGYRMIGLAYVPMMALIRSVDRQLWQAGAAGIDRAYAATKKLMMGTFALSVCVSALAFMLAPAVVEILPVSYSETAPVVRFLALLPIVKAIQFPLGNVLTMSGLPGVRFRLTLVAAAANLALNVLIITSRSWEGAAQATLATEAALAVALWLVVMRRSRSRANDRANVGAEPGMSAFPDPRVSR